MPRINPIPSIIIALCLAFWSGAAFGCSFILGAG